MYNFPYYQNHYKNHQVAFTLLELITVIIVLSILATLSIPRLRRDLKQEAADNILADIRYAQYLALTDYKHRADKPRWQRSFWRIGFNICREDDYYEYIGSDSMDYRGGIDIVEAAIDPSNGKKMLWSGSCSDGGNDITSNRIFLSHKFGIVKVETSGSCSSNNYIGFDHLGRPHNGFTRSNTPNYASIIQTECHFTFTMTDETDFTIIINPETGYAYIEGQENS